MRQKNMLKILGYNYNSSKWFEMSYKVFNKDYEFALKKKIQEKKDKGLIKKIVDGIKKN